VRTLLAVFGGLCLGLLLLGALALLLAGSWLTRDDDLAGLDREHPAAAIVVLGGSPFRPLHAADLYARELAPLIYVSAPVRAKDTPLLDSVDAAPLPQEEVYARLLKSRGVPAEAIRTFGAGLVSTAAEARELSRLLGPGPGALVVVTSPYHVLRTRLTFGREMPGWRVLVSGTPYEPFPARWWSTQQTALKVLSETAKLAYFLLGGRFGPDTYDAPAVLPAS
jgi:uncharacterized SAM-binding protein YcdF (DUF218 family)